MAGEIAKATRTLNLDVDDIDLPSFFVDLNFAEERVLRIARSPTVFGVIDRQARRVREWNAEETIRVLRISTLQESAHVQAYLDSFRSQNVDLITRMGSKMLDDMRGLVGEASTSGMRVETLKKRIQERFRVGESRAELIARDQTLKSNGALTMIHQRDAGVNEYIWITSQDERVRDEHAALHGERISWLEPPPLGHPGEDSQCRCTAQPVIPEF